MFVWHFKIESWWYFFSNEVKKPTKIDSAADKILVNFVTQCCDWPMRQIHVHDWLRALAGIWKMNCSKSTAVNDKGIEITSKIFTI